MEQDGEVNRDTHEIVDDARIYGRFGTDSATTRQSVADVPELD
jgi:hypothetical protein